MPAPLRLCAVACALLLLPLPPALVADVVPHATLPDRLVETRGAFVVEYSPGQEAWAEMAFQRLGAFPADPSGGPPALALDSLPRTPGSAADFRARRDVYLAAVAARIGLDAPTDLQKRTFDTFVGHYAVLEESLRLGLLRVLEVVQRPPRRITIWQRDDLKRRLVAGQAVPGFTYDPETDSGSFDLNFDAATEQTSEVRALRETIAAQRLDHEFDRTGSGVSAAVRIGSSLPPVGSVAVAAETAPPPPIPDLPYPVVYHGDFDAAADSGAFNHLGTLAQRMREPLARRIASFRDAITAFIVLHETAEIGLVENIIASPDRRWLCDGTANYVAMQILHELADPAFAATAFDLPRKLRSAAAHQPDIDLARWSAAERKDGPAMSPGLIEAHYTFATRAIAMIAERHGDAAIAQLWRDVARTPRDQTAAHTFTAAYRTRYAADLDALVRAAQSDPIPAAP